MDDLTTLLMINEGQTDPKKVAADKGLIFTEDLGIIDPNIVAELVGKISSYTSNSVWEALQMEGENQIKIAYQLVRDHKRILRTSQHHFLEHWSCANRQTKVWSHRQWRAFWHRRLQLGMPRSLDLPAQKRISRKTTMMTKMSTFRIFPTPTLMSSILAHPQVDHAYITI
jgi:hypothetical protein